MSNISRFFKKRPQLTSSNSQSQSQSAGLSQATSDFISYSNLNSVSDKDLRPKKKKRKIIKKLLCGIDSNYESDPDDPDFTLNDDSVSLVSSKDSSQSELSETVDGVNPNVAPVTQRPTVVNEVPEVGTGTEKQVPNEIQASGEIVETTAGNVNTDNAPSGDNANANDLGNGRSKVWDYFEDPVTIGSGKKVKKTVKCKLCKTNLAYCQTTTNLRNHLKSKHIDVWINFFADEIKEKTPLTEKDLGNLPKESKQSKIIKFLKTVTQYGKNSAIRRKLDRLLGLMIARDYQNLNVVENEGFRAFVAGLNPRYPLPSRKKLTTKILPSLYEEAYKNLKCMLEKTESVSITTDTWTSCANQSYLGITVHFFIDEQDPLIPPRLYSTTLDIIPITTDETARSLADLITTNLTEWNIFHKLKAVVTDNAANMKAAVDLLPESVKHFPCFAHTLNLVVKNSIINCTVPAIGEILSKVKSTATFFHHSPKAERILRRVNDKAGKLIQSVDTRWNSVVAMLRSYIANWEGLKVVSLRDKYRESFTLLSATEKEIVDELITILEAFESLTEDISGEKYVTISLIVPSITGLYNQFKEIETKLNNDESKQFLEDIRRWMAEKLNLYEDRTLCRISTILDPRYKKNGFRTSGVDEGVKSIQQEIKKIIQESDVSEPADVLPPPIPTTQTSKKKSALDFLPDETQAISNTLADAIVITRNYLSEKKLPKESSTEDMLVHLKTRFPQVYKVALQYLGIPGSSVPCERLFSSSGYLITDRRNRLSSENIAILTFLHYNYILIDN